MEEYNRYNVERIIKDTKNKVHLLLDYTDLKRDISDPWYTGNFDETYNDIMIGLDGFYNYLKANIYQKGIIGWYGVHLDIVSFTLLSFILAFAYFMKEK